MVQDNLAEFVFTSKYARVKVNGKKETYKESVERVINMHREHLKKIGVYSDEIEMLLNEVHILYKEKFILGAQRALQWGGEQLLTKHSRMYNCSSTYADRLEFFSELMFLLLSGAGVGFSVQRTHVIKLPVVKGIENTNDSIIFNIPDSIEGWSDTVAMLFDSYYNTGKKVEFNYDLIRPKGSFISGGFKAPGAEPLRKAVNQLTKVLDAAKNRKLTSIEVTDCACIIADSVISGGVRRAALLALFSADDLDFFNYKTGSWFYQHPYRSRVNITSVILPNTPKAMYLKAFEAAQHYGEPGIAFIESEDYAYNPCLTGDTMIAVADGRNAVSIKELHDEFISNNSAGIPVYSAKEVKAGRYKGNMKAEIKYAKDIWISGIKPTVEVTLNDGSKFRCTDNHKLALDDGTYLEAKYCSGKNMSMFFSTSNKNNKKSYRHINSTSNGHARQYRMIWEFNNGTYNTKELSVDHVDSASTNDAIENLRLISKYENNSRGRFGKQNTVYRRPPEIKQMFDSWRVTVRNLKLSKKQEYTEELAMEKFIENHGRSRVDAWMEYRCKDINIAPPETLSVISVEYTGLKEVVYDMTVEDNHNFYIITKTDDEQYLNSSGILVHNCFEVGMFPQINGESGFSFCNLTEIVGKRITTKEQFFAACRAASILGTIQATYTHIPYLGKITKDIMERDALIGVGITGMSEHPEIFFNPEIQREGAEIVKRTNIGVANLLKIKSAARCTVIKPSGNSAVITGTSSGIHPFHAKRFIRNVQVNKTEQAGKIIAEINAKQVRESVYNVNDYVISFPVELHGNIITKDLLTPVQFLDLVKTTQQNWIEYGTNFEHESYKQNPTLRHNVSNTVTIPTIEDWVEVQEYLWQNRKHFCGVSMLPQTGDTDYPQAPFIEVVDEVALAERYGAASILAGGLNVDGIHAFGDLWKAVKTAQTNIEIKVDTETILELIKENTKLVEGLPVFTYFVDGVCITDINAIIAKLNDDAKLKNDWVRRFNKFASKYFDGDTDKTGLCLKQVSIFHQWNQLTEIKPINWNDVEWEITNKVDAGADIASACSGGSCELISV